MNKKPHLKELETVEDFKIWEVDGNYIRNNVDREFTNFGQHFRFPFIPTHEFWIDKEYSPGESDFFINHMIVEWHLMKNGCPYDDALQVADTVEKNEREKSGLVNTIKKKISSLADLSKEGKETLSIRNQLYREKLPQYKVADVWIVNGEAVRDLYFIDFTEGGHHFVYDFVPFNEVWIDDDLSPNERGFVILHELHERYLMYTGLTYAQAHRSSSIVEYKCRNNPKLLHKFLRVEKERNSIIRE